MRINLTILPETSLLHLFDLFAKMENKILAMQVVKELAKRNHLKIDDQSRKLGQRANRRDNVISFQMITDLWESIKHGKE